MLRSMNNFGPGDFVRAGEHFGRVTERSLFHTELQTEDSDLTTLPNLLLVSTPVTVIRSEGTIVSATVSLGYDKSHTELDPILCEAATAAQLEKPFVQVIALADHAVTYRVAGFLPDVKWLLTARSNLRKSLLDKLHAAGIEIVSPSFMVQRPAAADEPVIPEPPTAEMVEEAESTAGPEDIVFDKADAAERVEHLRQAHGQAIREAQDLEQLLKAASDVERPRIEEQIAGSKAELESLEAALENAEDDSTKS
jgi:small conductance mechanosensitive channel